MTRRMKLAVPGVYGHDRGRGVDAGAGGVALFRSGTRRRRHPGLRAGGGRTASHFRLRASGKGRRPLPVGLRGPAEGRRPRLHGARSWSERARAFADRSLAARESGEFLTSHAIQALAIETAEAAAEWLHARLRELWGFADPAEMPMKDRFAARYRGNRFSFGYPACPDLDDQRGVVAAARPRRDRHHPHRRHDDGARSKRQRAGLPSSRSALFFGQRDPLTEEFGIRNSEFSSHTHREF